MALQNLRLGYLFSSTGSYELVARSMLNGALLAAEEINASGLGIRLEPSVLNPGGNLSQYSALAAKLLKREIRHVVGCYTSSSRKEVIPLFEKHDALLWCDASFRCQWVEGGSRCTKAAPQHRLFADHIKELRDGGAPFDPANGQCLCGAHHTHKTVQARANR